MIEDPAEILRALRQELREQNKEAGVHYRLSSVHLGVIKEKLKANRESIELLLAKLREADKRLDALETASIVRESRGKERHGETQVTVAKISSRPLVITAISGAALGVIGLLLQILQMLIRGS